MKRKQVLILISLLFSVIGISLIGRHFKIHESLEFFGGYDEIKITNKERISDNKREFFIDENNLELDRYVFLNKHPIKPDRKYSPGKNMSLKTKIGPKFYKALRDNKQSYISGTVPGEQREKKEILTILFYVYYYGSIPEWKFGLGRQPFIDAKCRINECSTTIDRRKVATADALLFHNSGFQTIPKRKLFPKYRRPPQQKWLLHAMESHVHALLKIETLRNLFNGTVTFQRHSDVYSPYGHYEPPGDPKHEKNKNYAEGKTELVAWFVSHCKCQSQRDIYGDALSKYLPIHMYGNCGKVRRNCSNSRRGRELCYSMLDRKYKFYLSFENSLCADYITEKVYKILEKHVIPIVLGNNAYEEILPKHSFIDVRSFRSPKYLADYIKYLDKNDTAFNEYFEWKNHYHIINHNNKNLLCDICEYLHTSRNWTKIYTKPELHWNRKTQCLKPSQYYKGIADEILDKLRK